MLQVLDHRRTGPFEIFFRGGGGGAQHFLPGSLILAQKSTMFAWAMHFCRTWGEGQGGGRDWV